MKRKLLPEQEIISKYNANQSILFLSNQYSCGQGKIKRILDKHNIHIRGMSECQLKTSTYIPDEKYKEVEELYNSGMSTYQLAKHYNCNRKYIVTYMKRNWIKRRKDYSDPVYPILLENKEIIIDMYKTYTSIKPIAKHFNCSGWTIQHFMDKEGICRKHKPYKVGIPLTDIDKLYKLHHDEEYAMQQLADLYNCSAPTMQKFFDDNSIKHRTVKEANLITSGNIEKFNKGKASCYKSKQYTLPSGDIINLQGYEPQFLDYVFENNIYKEEDFDFSTKRISYKFEGKFHYYFPDFYIPKDNLIIEVKSSYILKIQGENKNKAKRDATITQGYDYLMVLDNIFTKFIKKE